MAPRLVTEEVLSRERMGTAPLEPFEQETDVLDLARRTARAAHHAWNIAAEARDNVGRPKSDRGPATGLYLAIGDLAESQGQVLAAVAGIGTPAREELTPRGMRIIPATGLYLEITNLKQAQTGRDSNAAIVEDLGHTVIEERRERNQRAASIRGWIGIAVAWLFTMGGAAMLARACGKG
jgi:hypothetical protein